MKNTLRITTLTAGLLAFSVACGDDVENPGNGGNEEEVITTAALTFTPMGGGTPITATFDDPDGDGGNAPTIDTITLTRGSTYAVTVTFTNKLETPAEDITEEIMAEDDEHQIFFTGTAVMGPATGANANAILTHEYADMDGGGLAVGLTNTFIATAAGTGQLTMTLRHLPPGSDGVAVKTAQLASMVASGGITSIAGDTDVSVTFEVTVQ